MKLYNILLFLIASLLLTSCITSPETHPVYDSFVCVINSDGTGFQKLIKVSQLPFEPSELWDMYVTQDEKLIFAADRYYITDPDSINPIPFSDVLTENPRRMTFSTSNRAYYCANGDLYQYDFSTNTTSNLTANNNGHYMNPIISPDDQIITFFEGSYNKTRNRSLCFYRLSDDSLHTIPEAGETITKGMFNPADNKIYYEKDNGLYSINLNGNQNTQMLTYFSAPQLLFDFTLLNDNLVITDARKILRMIKIDNLSTDLNIQLEGLLPLAKNARQSKRVFYELDGNIYFYNIESHDYIKIPNTTNVNLTICPTWDGSKIFFIADLRVNK